MYVCDSMCVNHSNDNKCHVVYSFGLSLTQIWPVPMSAWAIPSVIEIVHGMSPTVKFIVRLLADWTSLEGESNLPKRVIYKLYIRCVINHMKALSSNGI